MTWGTYGSVLGSQTAASMWEGRSLKPTNPSLQVRRSLAPSTLASATRREAPELASARRVCASSYWSLVESHKHFKKAMEGLFPGLICCGQVLQWVLIHLTTLVWPCLTQMIVGSRRLRGWLSSPACLHLTWWQQQYREGNADKRAPLQILQHFGVVIVQL